MAQDLQPCCEQVWDVGVRGRVGKRTSMDEVLKVEKRVGNGGGFTREL